MATVLVVDDNLDTCKVLAAFLARGGHHPTCAASAPEAMAMLLDAHRPLPDVILTDLMMPGESGIDLLKAIRAAKRLREIPVIVYSAVSEHRYVEQAMNAGATDYWLKGAITPGEVQSRLAAFLPAGAGWAAPIRHDPVHAR